MKTLRDLSNDELLSGLDSLLGRQRELLARLLVYLIEVEPGACISSRLIPPSSSFAPSSSG